MCVAVPSRLIQTMLTLAVSTKSNGTHPKMVVRLKPTFKKTAINVYRCQRCDCPRCRDIRELPSFLTIKCDCWYCSLYAIRSSGNYIRMSSRRSKHPERLSSTDLVKTSTQLRGELERKKYEKLQERKRRKRWGRIYKQRHEASEELYKSDAGQRRRCKRIAAQLHKSCSIFDRYLRSLSEIKPHNLVTSKMILLKKKLGRIADKICTINKTNLPKSHHYDDINDLCFMSHKLYECKGQPETGAVKEDEEAIPANGRTKET